ncbi:c-type cytochrome [Rhodobacteraceae bacterium 2CG4]|jgi:mono/diheme cytochrome c family protein|uniref:C-type cytochrome n=1 Tax=Halovulum marinum TaxID=2662447 RepID=A0A6L5Z880_9RHOB|nr:cytochrome c [Halovulum marinum]MSU92122.1 c-type cytochrome [Halovulum marinum]
MAVKKFAIAMLFVGGLGTTLVAQSDEERDRPRVSTQMHGADAANPAPDTETINVPETLSAPAYFGQIAFERACSSCHGTNGAGGTGKGPPLIHPIYEPGHHGDTAFLRAAMAGVRSHHWDFGDMPPVEGITDETVALIVAYVRELQRANGIE